MRYLSFLSLFVIAACGSAHDVTLQFEGLVGSEPARCGQTYTGIGTTGTDLRLGDFRMYVHDVRLVTEDGRELPIALAQDQAWQVGDVAMLDFEDHSADCAMGTDGTSTTVRGTVTEPGPYRGVRLRLGVPFELNHDDASTAPAPLSYSTMFWGWNGGYKYLRVDAYSTGQPEGLVVHLGATGCEGDRRGNITGCTQDNRAEIALDGFDPTADRIAVDLGALLSQSDLDTDAGGPATCMSGFDDPDCEAVFHAVGLPFAGRAPAGPQRFMRVLSR